MVQVLNNLTDIDQFNRFVQSITFYECNFIGQFIYDFDSQSAIQSFSKGVDGFAVGRPKSIFYYIAQPITSYLVQYGSITVLHSPY